MPNKKASSSQISNIFPILANSSIISSSSGPRQLQLPMELHVQLLLFVPLRKWLIIFLPFSNTLLYSFPDNRLRRYLTNLPAVEALQQLDARHEEQKEKLEQLFRQQKEELEKQMEKLRKQMKKLDQQFRERSEKLEQSYIVNCQEILALIPGTSSQKVVPIRQEAHDLKQLTHQKQALKCAGGKLIDSLPAAARRLSIVQGVGPLFYLKEDNKTELWRAPHLSTALEYQLRTEVCIRRSSRNSSQLLIKVVTTKVATGWANWQQKGLVYSTYNDIPLVLANDCRLEMWAKDASSESSPHWRPLIFGEAGSKVMRAAIERDLTKTTKTSTPPMTKLRLTLSYENIQQKKSLSPHTCCLTIAWPLQPAAAGVK